MGYSLKMTGLTEVRKMLGDYKKLVTETVDGLNGDVRLPIPNIGVDLVITGLDKAKKPLDVLQKQIKKAGSAIFIHQWRRPGYPTAGCIGLSRQNLSYVANFVGYGSRLIVTDCNHARRK